MDIKRLCDITVKATLHTLRYHAGAKVIDEDVQALIREEIHELYHLRTRAQDTNVADLEIACDAAITVAEAYNKSDPELSRINLRWFYISVQGLLLVDLLPAALLDDNVTRLPRKVQEPIPTNSPSASVSKNSPPASSSTLDLNTTTSPAEQSPPSNYNNKPVPAKAAKAKWEHDEIQRMVQLKASGLRHCDVATRLGRGQGSVENKYGRIMHEEEWKDYSTSFEASLRPKDADTEDDGRQLSLP